MSSGESDSPDVSDSSTHDSEEKNLSESVESTLVLRGFDDPTEEEIGVRQLDDETQESEDWAERDLRELRTHVATHKEVSRRQTVNGIDVAPRSELSPPINTTDTQEAPVLEEKTSKGLRGKLSKQSSNAEFFMDGSSSNLPKKGTFSRFGSKAFGTKRGEKKHDRKKSLRNSSQDIFNRSQADSINDSLSGPDGSPPPALPEKKSRNAEELFRFVLERALEDEKPLQSYVFTLAYFADPVHVLSDLITEHDVAVASMGYVDPDGDDGDADEGVSLGADRAMKVVSFWVSHLWYQFEGSDALMNLLMHFVNVSLKGKRWGERLSDTIATLVEGRKTLKKTLDGLFAHGKGLASKEDIFSMIDPDDDEDLDDEEPLIDEEEDFQKEEEELAAPEDVTATFVGGETYTDKSKPMGLADLSALWDDAMSGMESKDEATGKEDVGGGKGKGKEEGAKSASSKKVSSTLVGADKYNPSSRPMGLFGLLESNDSGGQRGSIWDANPEALSFADRSASSLSNVRASDIARQLTMIEFFQWKLVSPLELQQAMWKDNTDEKGNYIRQVIAWHNKVANWVQCEVLKRTNQDDRVQAVQRFLAICLHLEKLQNYHSMFGILAGLRVGVVSRLKIHERLSPAWAKIYTRMGEVGSTRNNWEAYRAVKNRATKFPFFPYVGVYLQDLQVLEAREKTFVGEGAGGKLVNFEKMEKLGSLLIELVYVQRGSEYNFRHHPRVISYLMSLPTRSEDELWELSYAILPPVGDGEHHERATDKSFLASAISPRGSPPAKPEIPTVAIGGRERSFSNGDTFRRWKPRGGSEGGDRRPAKSGPSSPRGGVVSIPKSGSSSPRQKSPRGGDSSYSSRSPSPRPTDFLCPLCSASFPSKAKLVDHLTREMCSGSSLKQHTCPVCEGSFASAEELIPHLSKRSCSPRPQGLRYCPICNSKFSTGDELRGHLHSRACFN